MIQIEPLKLADLDWAAEATLVRASVDWTGSPLVAAMPAAAAAAAPAARPLRLEPYRLAIRRLVDGGWQELPPIETTHPAPHVQTLPGDLVLVVGTTSRRGHEGTAERNATIHGPDGSELASFVAGDGVEDVQVTAGGEIWVSYFDDGTMGDYGRFGWGRLSPRVWIEPVGGSGLVRFDRSGERVYEYVPPDGLAPAADCFALNVPDDGSAWLSYHPGFPLVHVENRTAAWWETGWRGVDAVAVSGARVLHYERFGSQRGTCRYGRLVGGSFVELDRFEPVLPTGRRLGRATWVLGRGPSLHVVDGGSWYRLDVPGGES